MKTIRGLVCLVLVSGIVGGCAGAVPAPHENPAQCPPSEQLVCTGKSATRIKGASSDMEFCSCRPADQID